MLNLFMAALALLAGAPEKKPYSFDALFVEGCSCSGVCVTEITGVDAGCHGLAAMEFHRGSYGGADFSGSRAAWAFTPEKTVVIYIDAPEPKRAALSAFLKAALADWGKLEAVKTTPIHVTHPKDSYRVTIGTGSIGKIQVSSDTSGGSVKLSNLKSLFHSELIHGQTRAASFADQGHRFELKQSNGYYYPHCVMHGKL